MQGKGYSVFRLKSAIYTAVLCLSQLPTAIKLRGVWFITRLQAFSVPSVGTCEIPVLCETLMEWQNVAQD